MPGVAIHVFNKGIGGQDADEMTARMKADVQPERAHLVVWQVGTNSAIRRIPTDQFAKRLGAGIDIGKSLGANFVLMNLQYVPAVVALPDEEEYARVMAEVAKEMRVLLVDRFEAMRELQRERGDLFYLATDKLHPNDRGHRCMAEQVARAIVGGLMQADAEQSQPLFYP